MSTVVLIHGAGDVGWSWHLVVAELRALGHDAVTPDLPCEDQDAGLPEFAETVLAEVGERRDLVVVGHSFGGLTAPLVADRRRDAGLMRLVYLAAMIPAPGERPADWWENTGYERAAREQIGRASCRERV